MNGHPGEAIGGLLEHATVVEIDGRGVMIRGASGSGKTSLAIELIHRCRRCGIAAFLVADDYTLLSADPETGKLASEVPGRIAGLIELRGYGIVEVGRDRFKPETRLSLAVTLVDPAEAERVADPDRTIGLAGNSLPELALPRNSPVNAANAVIGWLGLAGKLL